MPHRRPRLEPALPWVLLPALVLAAHLPELAGVVSSNPAYLVSQLGVLAHGSPVPALPGWIDPNAGFTTQALGGLAAREWLEGRVPWWNPYSGIGLPLAAEAQGSALFLPFVLLLRWFDGVLYLKITMQVLAGWATLALLRRLGCSPWASGIGAALFALGGTFAWFAHAPILPIAFLPLLLLGIEHARGGGGWVWIGVAIGWSLLTGFPETAYLDGLLALVWAGLRLLQAGRGARLGLLGRLAAGGVAGVLIAAPQVGPLLHLLAHAYTGVHDVVPRFHMQPWVSAAMLVPLLYGPIGARGHGDWGTVGGYVGLPLLLLALLALAGRGPERALRWLLAAWVVVGYLKATNTGLVTGAVNLVPLVAQTMFARLVQPSWQMAGVVLAALALDDWRRGTAPGAAGRAAVLGVLALLTAGAAWRGWDMLARVWGDVEHAWLVSTAATAWSALVLAALLAAVFGPVSRARVGVPAAALMLDAAVQFMAPLAAGVRDARLDLAPVAFLRDHLGLQRFATAGPFAPNYGALYGIASVNHNALPVPRAWVDETRAALDPAADDVVFDGADPPPAADRARAIRAHLAGYAALGVRYVAALPGARLLGADHPPVFASTTLELYELADAAPYWDVAGGPCVLSDQRRERVTARCAAPATLVRRELDFPGWRAWVDEREAAVGAAAPVFQSVGLPPGEHAVRFGYAPPYAPALWAACAAGAAMLALGALTARRRAPSVPPRAGEE